MRVFLTGMGLALVGLASSPAWAGSKIDKLIKDLDTVYKAKRLEAIKELGQQGTAAKEAAAPLAKQMRLKDAEIANQAARSLAQLGAGAVPEVLKALEDPSATVRNRALLTLGTMGREAGKAALPVGQLLKHEDAQVRFLAALVLGAMHEEARPAAAMLEQALLDSDPQVRFVAADSLFQIGQEAVPHLLEALQSEDPAIRFNALNALGRFSGSEKAAQALADGLKDNHFRIRALAADSLIRLGPLAKDAIPRLLENLKTEDREVQVKAFTAILGIRAGDSELCEALSAANENGRWAAVDTWPLINPRAVPFLKAMLTSPEPSQRLGAALALAQMGPTAKDASAVLKNLQGDRDRSVRAAAHLATAAIDPKGIKEFDKTANLIEDALERQRGSSDPGELIRLHILLSTLPSLKMRGNGPGDRATKRLQEFTTEVGMTLGERRFSLEDMGVLVDGINLTAQWNLGFTEPFNRLAFETQKAVHNAKDPQVALYLYKNLGKGVSPDSVYWPAMQQLWLEFLPKVPLDLLVFEQTQKIQQQALVLSRLEGQHKMLSSLKFPKPLWLVSIQEYLGRFS